MPRFLISGLGLIGGSIALALRARGRLVAYVDPAVPLDQARAAGAADMRLDDLDEARHDDVIVLASPVDTAMRTLASLAASHAAVTSVCSVMAPLRDLASPVRFVAGHPFAGAESRGLGAARADLFEGKPWFVDERADYALVAELIAGCGARAVAVDAEKHDEIVALTSHLPQLISTALASTIAERSIPAEFIGSGLQTLLRLAGSAHSVWHPVIEANAANIDAARTAFEEALHRVESGEAAADFERANDFSRR